MQRYGMSIFRSKTTSLIRSHQMLFQGYKRHPRLLSDRPRNSGGDDQTYPLHPKLSSSMGRTERALRRGRRVRHVPRQR